MQDGDERASLDPVHGPHLLQGTLVNHLDPTAQDPKAKMRQHLRS